MNDNWGLIGHAWAVNMLKHQIVNTALRHAYLFTGPSGLGRRTLALRFAQAINCSNPPETGVPCRSCRDCRQIERMQHADLFVLQVEKEAGALKVEQIRELQHSLALAAYQSRFRIALLLHFEEASASAANALLKTLEEAPAHVLLMLTASDASNLLPTIASRCEILRLWPIPIESLEKSLLSGGVDPENARLYAHISGGRPGYANRLMNDPSLLDSRQACLADLRYLLKASRIQKFSFAERMAKDRDQFKEHLDIWLSCWRDVLLKATHAEVPLTNIDISEELTTLAGKLEPSNVLQTVEEHRLALERLDRYVNARLLAENLLLRLPVVSSPLSGNVSEP